MSRHFLCIALSILFLHQSPVRAQQSFTSRTVTERGLQAQLCLPMTTALKPPIVIAFGGSDTI